MKKIGDIVLENALNSAMSWLSEDQAMKAVNSSLRTIERLTAYLETCSFDHMRVSEAAKTATYLSKMVDEMARLVELVQGRADSRTETKISELDYLTNEQFQQLCIWVEEGKTRQATPEYDA